jgi:biofilm PGA synthesis lipoprotein PgaB
MFSRGARSGSIGAALLSGGLLLWMSAAKAEEIPQFFALCYHNIEDEAPDQHYVGVTTRRLVEQLSWLQRNGFHAVSVDDILAARSVRKPLSDKAYLISFDDGFESFYTRAFPILKAFNVPAVVAIEGNWVAETRSGVVDYAGESASRDLFLTWAQIREAVASGLVEVAAHTMDLHRGALANPQGNFEPSAVTHRYDPAKGYESDDAYRARIVADTEKIAKTIERELGRRPRVMIWPYGEHNERAISIVGALGMPITMSLVDAPATLDGLAAMPRHLINDDPTLNGFVQDLHDLSGSAPMRAVQVDLDYVYDPDAAQAERNLGVLVQHIRDLHINTVFLQAFADPAGDGLAREVYFPNRQLPMRADLFNRAAWQLRTRAHVKVFAWLPVLAFDFGDKAGALQHVQALSSETHQATVDEEQYLRLSPFDASARAKITELYEELATNASIEGLLFHDDALLSDFEDASPAALAAYRAAGFPGSIDAIRGNRELLARWTSFKTDAIIQFTAELAQHVRIYRSPIRTVRNIYARPVLQKESVQWFAQDYDRFLAEYDMVAVMAMPLMEGIPRKEAQAWLGRLVRQAKARPTGLKRTLFELQSVDWNRRSLATGHNVPTEDLAAQMRFLERQGALNFGYYPDDFLHDHPRAELIHPVMSLQSHPYPQP